MAAAFTAGWIQVFGPPERLLSDNGSQMTSHMLTELYTLLDIKKIWSSPYHPAGNGSVERTNRTMNNMLAKFVKEDQSDWDSFLGLVVFAYNSSTHSRTGASPYLIMFGREAPSVIDAVHSASAEHFNTLWGAKANRVWQTLYDEAIISREHLSHVQEHVKMLRANGASVGIDIGDWVWYEDPRTPAGLKRKHQLPGCGPFVVTEIRGPMAFVVEHGLLHTSKRVHWHQITKITGTLLQRLMASSSRDETLLSLSVPAPDSVLVARAKPSSTKAKFILQKGAKTRAIVDLSYVNDATTATTIRKPRSIRAMVDLSHVNDTTTTTTIQKPYDITSTAPPNAPDSEDDISLAADPRVLAIPLAVVSQTRSGRHVTLPSRFLMALDALVLEEKEAQGGQAEQARML